MASSERRESLRKLSAKNIDDDDEQGLKWAAIEKLPTYDKLRTSLMVESFIREGGGGVDKIKFKEVDVGNMGLMEKQNFVESLFKRIVEDNEKLLRKFRARVHRVGITLPTVEVRFENLTVDAKCLVGGRSLPTLWNSARNFIEALLDIVGLSSMKKTKLAILKDVSGIIKPSRMTLLLGPPGSGKTTLLLALAGRLDKGLKVNGHVTYNGHSLEEFVPQKTSSYISQNDLHVGVMTVRETLNFSARCQGVGCRYDLLSEVCNREKDAGIFPDAEVDLFMKATAMGGVQNSLQTEYALKILGLDICADTIVGDEMHRGISGGQRKRVTTGEIIVGPPTVLFMDEISTGLDSSTTYQVVKCTQQFCSLADATILMSLLQPAPEVYELFDNIILLSEGEVVYQGPREHVLEFFESCGFQCPERKGVADFLQEVTSMKDQEQYWADRNGPYRYISVKEFANMYKRFHVGRELLGELSAPYDKCQSHKASLVLSKYSVPKMEIFKACFAKEWLLLKRNSFVYIFKTVQIIIVAFIVVTVFLRTRMHQRNEEDANLYLGALFFSLLTIMFNGAAELQFTLNRLPVFFKQRDLLLYPAWAFSIPSLLLSIPISIVETFVWVVMTYYGIGFAPGGERFFRQFLILFLVHQMSSALFRCLAGLCRTQTVANTAGALSLLIIFMVGGFLIPKGSIPNWWIWAYWCSPLVYGQNAILVNEMLAPRWNKSTEGSENLGIDVLERRNINPEGYSYWIGAAALIGFSVVFNLLFTMALAYLNPLGKPQAVISEEKLADQQCIESKIISKNQDPRLLPLTSKRGSFQIVSSKDGKDTEEMQMHHTNSVSVRHETNSTEPATGVLPKRGMILPFMPLAMSFDDVNYFVDMPPEIKQQGVIEDRLQLLHDVTGAFRPGFLTALMGVSGAGKTTLMDVLAGRKTGGYIEGDIRISGFPKKQETFARISGYCEQNDIHSPQVTVRESLIYSAFLRLPKEIDKKTKIAFVDEVMELVELDNLSDGLVGLPTVTGLSTEQRKRLTIAVELVANPSIIFMDEPTSGLDARAAAIVMRTVRNTVDTGRTVVCTIHQPSIDIFEAFDELLLMKRGGQVIYAGPLGQNSHKVVEYFEAIPGVPKIKEKYNPATWMLDVSSTAAEIRLGIDFAEHYKNSSLYQRNKGLVREISTLASGAGDLYFPTQYSQSFFGQFKSCLWKQSWTYWRSPDYNSIRMLATIITAVVFGSVFWNIASKRKIPKWWIWYYWICPVAWTVYGLIVSQYGDITDLIEVDGKKPGMPLNQYLEEYFWIQ
ncbi:hypothetical protein KI387_027843 [Taxus chinensis]|uniref:ABC transporter domain-containing protein n=1 Tax=Taxus chinensis TaxID=29808 RepID=A0AA38G0D0_TAXCH|nr:hypothetical protein KI387_027843 [Taxus chinensis]